MGASDLIREEEVNYGHSPVTHSYSSFMDIAKSMYDYQVENLNITSSIDSLHEESQAGIEAFKKLTGDEVNLGRAGLNMSNMQYYESHMDKRIEQMRLEAGGEWNNIPTSSEVREKAMQRARDSKIAYDENIMNAAPDGWTGTATFAGGTLGWIANPTQAALTVLTIPVGGAVGSKIGQGVFAMAAGEAFTAVATESALQPFIADYQNQVGHDYGIEDIGMNILFAGGAGFGIPLALHGVGSAVRYGKDFSGITAENMRAIYNLGKQEALNKRPRTTDHEGDVAFKNNLETASDAVYAGRIPDAVEFDKRASPRIFDEDAVTYEHATVARKIIDSGVKKTEQESVMRREFINEMIDEHSIDANLPRGDFKRLTDELKKISAESEALRAEWKAARAKTRALENKPLDNDAQVASLLDSQNAEKAAYTNYAKKLEQKRGAERSIESHTKAVEADTNLSALKNYQIPVALEKRYADYKKNVKNALIDIAEYEKKMAAVADDIIAQRNMIEPDAKVDIHEDIEIKNSPDIGKANAQVYKAFVAKSLTDEKMVKQKYKVYDEETGDMVEMKIEDIDEFVKENDKIMSILKSCFMGGGK